MFQETVFFENRRSRAIRVHLVFIFLLFGGLLDQSSFGKPRARDLGIPFQGTPGELNAITDVKGVAVGHSTIIKGRARTGVTAIFPLGKMSTQDVAANWAVFNGDGELTGAHYLREFGKLNGPILITNTLSVGTVHAAAIEWSRDRLESLWALPVVAETWDGFLNDIQGLHVKRKHVFEALDDAATGPVAEGNVGGGTGMRTFEFKSGIGTASRIVSTEQGQKTLGVLVQSNFGRRHQLRIAGLPIGDQFEDLMPELGESVNTNGNSIIVVIGTDVPLIPIQLERIAKRAALALGRVGSIGMEGSGDFFIAFSTANRFETEKEGVVRFKASPSLNPLFEAVVQATEEAIINSLVAAETMVGYKGNTIHAIPHDRLSAVLADHGILNN